jgi:all-trans-8'-apo-beta-carotenal 15,15'-oxygenase
MSAMAETSGGDWWLAKLGEGTREEFDYAPEIEGRLPAGLSGTLYRNGPGLYERAGFKKWNLLDGDGMIRATSFAGGSVRFRTRFVRTKKFEAEEKAGRFLHPTWTTPAPRRWENIPGYPRLGQAGVTAAVKSGRLYAFDEVGLPYGLDPASLETTGIVDPDSGAPAKGPSDYKAHTKTDGENGDWVMIGTRGRVKQDLHVLVKDRAGRHKAQAVLPSPRGEAYFHDFFWASPYAVFLLQPALLSPLPMVLGFRSYTDSLRWTPSAGGLLVVVDTSGKRAPLTLDVPAVWMWHALNAHVAGDRILADFVGYDAPDHFLGPDAAFRTIMQGRRGLAKAPGMLRRFTIDLQARKAGMETIAEGHFEFPMAHPGRVGRKHRYGYVAMGDISHDWYQTGVARIDVESGARSEFAFGTDFYVGEPIFAPDPAAAADPAATEDRGWILAEVLDGKRGKSFLAVFVAAHLGDGPVAKLNLRTHLPMSFHGWWEAA